MNKNIYKIIEILNKDGVVVLPTDTVYGLCASFESIKAYINKEQEQILNVFWPGSVTCVLKSKVKDLNTIAIRIPDDKLLLKILLEFKKPLWQTSANLRSEEH